MANTLAEPGLNNPLTRPNTNCIGQNSHQILYAT